MKHAVIILTVALICFYAHLSGYQKGYTAAGLDRKDVYHAGLKAGAESAILLAMNDCMKNPKNCEI